MKTCCIISKTPSSWSEFEGSFKYDVWAEGIEKLVLSLSEEGVTEFISPMSLGAETVFSEAVLNLKRHSAWVNLECAIPYEAWAKDWTEPERDRYFKVMESCDRETLVSIRYSDKAEEDCYKYMINKSDIIIISEASKEALSHIIGDIRNRNKRYIYI